MNADLLTCSDYEPDFVGADKVEGAGDEDFWQRVDAAIEEWKYGE